MIDQQHLEQPSAAAVGNEMARRLGPDGLKIVGVWLGLSAVEMDSEPIYQLGKQVLSMAVYSDRAEGDLN